MNTPYELPTELTIYSVVEVRDTLLAWVGEQSARSGGQFVINGARVQEVDGAGLQLLCALFNADLPLRLADPSEALTAACHTVGLVAWLGEYRSMPGATGVMS